MRAVTNRAIGVLGASGQVGSALVERCRRLSWDIHAPTSGEINLLKPAELKRWVGTNEFHFVINCAAYTDVDGAESNANDCESVNHQGVHNLLNALAETPTRLLHLSTDYVFDGSSERAYAEDAAANPLNVYGRSKAAAEEAVVNAVSLVQAIVLRVGWIFSARASSFPSKIVKQALLAKPLRVVADQHGTPNSSEAVADTILFLVNHHAKFDDRELFNMSSHPRVSWYEFAQAILERACNIGLLSDFPGIEPASSQTLNATAQRPKFSVLDSTKLQSYGWEQPSWATDLDAILQDLDAHE